MRTHGKAARGLAQGTSSGALDKKRAGAGAIAERNLDVLLREEFATDEVDIYRSMKVPGKEAWGVDVDFIILSRDTMVLIDCKAGKKSGFLWSMSGLMYNGLRREREPGKKNGEKGAVRGKMSKSMIMAQNIYGEHLHSMRVPMKKKGVPAGTRPAIKNVYSVVIYTRMTLRNSNPPGVNVHFLTWPGKIRSYRDTQGIRKVRQLLGGSRLGYAHPSVINYLNRYTK